ncbi:hypothetical protein G6O69_27200 [Pseudenhygromyxa sp. WMMC2535]|uniref:hypothetical protein n=1 Tax=Pseudenhygromyxa sp. WMMC2535 TaxID=2712867 RepID=UPI0015539CF2|nr:hypothetical protein [Pseudenhygromyxa sp. WMMC2535]NVB41556.1 hypothetical protein [Pseudenhygromyxa sp. WMMC2535]
MRMNFTLPTSLAVLGLLATSVNATGCANRKKPTNEDLLAEYSGDKYSQDMVAADYETVEDQGDSIDPRTQASIQDAISTVWVTDFENCLEKEMSRLENRWLAGEFSIEFTIEPSGMVSAATVLEHDIMERRTPNAEGEYVSEGGAEPRKAEEFASCVEEKAYKWEFDPAPEVTYTHTYNGSVGEAW